MAIFCGWYSRYERCLFHLTCTDYIYNYLASDKSLSERNKLGRRVGWRGTPVPVNVVKRTRVSVLGTPKCKLLESRSVRFC